MTNQAQTGAQAATGQAAALPARPVFSEFQWVRPEGLPGGFFSNAEVLHFVGLVRDVANGAQTILQVLEGEEHARLSDEPTLLGGVHGGHLQRLCIVSLGMLGDVATRMQEDASNNQERGGAVA